MNFSKDYFIIVWNNMKNKRLRSFLTLIGIIIGVVAIVLLYTAGETMESVATAGFDRLGTDIVWVGPRAVGFGGPSGYGDMTQDDVDVVNRLKEVDDTVAFLSLTVEVEFNNEEKIMSVFAIDTDNLDRFARKIGVIAEEGRIFNNGEDGPVAIIGGTAAREMFDKPIYMRNKITIEGRDFRVIGILKEEGDQGDNLIRIPIAQMRELFDLENDEISAFQALLKPGVTPDEGEAAIFKALEKHRDEEDFTVTSPAKVREQIENVLGVIRLVIVAIALVSLFVGGIGIMNSMYTSVMERTNEIGTMKAVGARNSDILSIFLIESALMGFLGGLFALLISAGLIFIANIGIAATGVLNTTAAYNPYLFGFGLLFAIITGVGAGLTPAWKAAHLKPVDALRYE